MQASAIPYRNGKLEACEEDDQWTVRLANLEARARYLDLALAELLRNTAEAHRAAARLLAKMQEVVEQPHTADSHVAAIPLRERRRAPHREVRPKLRQLGLRIVAFSVVASTAFMLTTWFSTLH